MLSNLDLLGFAPYSSNEFGLGFLREPAASTSLWNRPRSRRGGLSPAAAPFKSVFDPSGEAEGNTKPAPGGVECSPDTVRGNGTAPSLPSSGEAEPSLRGMYTPFLFPGALELLRLSTMRRGGEPLVSGDESRGSSWSLGSKPGVSTLCRARWVGLRGNCGSDSTLPFGDRAENASLLRGGETERGVWTDALRDSSSSKRDDFGAGNESKPRKSSGHFPFPSFIGMGVPLEGTRPLSDSVLSERVLLVALSSVSSTTLDRSTIAVSLGRRSREGREGESMLRFRFSSLNDGAMLLPSVRVMDGDSDGAREVTSVVTVRIVPNLLWLPGVRGGSSKLENMVVSVRLLDACD